MDKIVVAEVSSQSFKFESKAYIKLEGYIDSIKEHFSEHKDSKEIISDMQDRISEQLLVLLSKQGFDVVGLDEVAKVVESIGSIKSIDQESPEEEKPKNNKKKISKIHKIARFLGYSLFWMPHTLWVAYILGGSFLLISVVLTGPETLTFPLLLTYLGALLLPTVGIVVGIILHRKKKLRAMLQFLLGIEIPLFLLSMFRLFYFQAFSGAIAFMYILIGIACITLYLDLLGGKLVKKLKQNFDYIKLTGYSVGVLMSGYVLVIWSFFFPYILTLILSVVNSFFDELFGFNPYNDGGIGLNFLSFSPLLLIVFFYALFFYLSPVYVFPIYVNKLLKTWRLVLGKILKKQDGKFSIQKEQVSIVNVGKLFLPIISIGISIIVVIVLLVNPHSSLRGYVSRISEYTGVFKGLEEQYSPFYKNESVTRDIIVDKFIARYGYLLDDNSSDMFDSLYCNTSNSWDRNYDSEIEISLPQIYCDAIYDVFSFVAAPVVYNGDLDDDFARADIEYKKIFDDSIQRAEADKINKYTSNTMGDSFIDIRGVIDDSAGLVDEDKKSVEITNLNILSDINPKDSLHKTQYIFTLVNKEITNQEVYLEFSLPEGSVISDLRLGTKLQNLGVVAPKAAAHEVYERSLTRSIDPALLELVGPRTYRLRVYPIPPKNGGTQWVWDEQRNRSVEVRVPEFQRVMIEYSGVINNTYELLKFPYSRNLDITNKTEIGGTISIDGDTGFNQRQINIHDSNIKVKGGRTTGSYSWKYDGKDKRSFLQDDFEETVRINFLGNKNQFYSCYVSEGKQHIRLFVDVSKSSDSKDTIELYKAIVRQLDKDANHTAVFDVYEYNFDVNSSLKNVSSSEVIHWMDSINFWGYSDKSFIAEYVATTVDATTYILTDDSDFEFTEESKYSFDYTQNKNNTINLIQIGNRLTSQKEEINNLVWASGGDSILIRNINDIKQLDSFLDMDCVVRKVNDISDEKWQEVVEDLSNLKQSKVSIAGITGEESRLIVARMTTDRVVMSHIIDPFHSMIALETSWQENLLENLSDDDDAFNQEHDIGEQSLVLPGMIGQSLPEADILVTIVLMISLSSIVIFIEKKKMSTT